jgi:tetratricopeptide (TPR) repeat protein
MMTDKKTKTRRKKADTPDERLAMVLMRYAAGWWEQAKLAVAARFQPTQVGMWDRGDRPVPRYALERTADATNFPRYLLGAVLRAIRSFRLAAKGKSRPGRTLAEVSLVELFPLAASALDLILDPLSAAEHRQEQARPSAADREQAEALFERLKRRTAKQRWLLVDRVAEFRHWALVVLVAAESLRLAPNEPTKSLEWAKLALRIAELVSGVEEWRWRLQGYAGAVLTNSFRVCNDLPAARAARARARQLWEAGAPGDPGLLNEALLPWIEAALHLAERDFPAALERVEEALALDNGELKGKILLTKAGVLYNLGGSAASIAAIEEAVPLLDTEREPRLAWLACQKLVVALADLGRAKEARLRLPEVRKLVGRSGGELDDARVVWLEGLIAAELGDLSEARNRFEQVRRAFEKPELTYDHALVSLDLSVVLLKQGETAQVRAIAEQMLPIFQSQQVHREALAALRVFYEAATQEAATVELAQKVARYLRRAQDDPDLRFDQAGAE